MAWGSGGARDRCAYVLPVLAQDRSRLAVAVLLANPDDLETFMANEPTRDDLVEIIRSVQVKV